MPTTPAPQLSPEQLPQASMVISAIRDAIRLGSAQLIVQHGAEQGAIHVHEGRIGWIHTSTDSDSSRELLPEVPRDQVRQLMEMCRTSKSNVLEVALAMHLVDRDVLRDRLERVFRRRLVHLLTLQSATVTIVPRPFQYGTEMLFFVEQLLPAPPRRGPKSDPALLEATTVPARPSRELTAPRATAESNIHEVRTRPASVPPERYRYFRELGTTTAAHMLAKAMLIQSVAGVCLLDRATGETSGERGVVVPRASIETYLAYLSHLDDAGAAEVPGATHTAVLIVPLAASPRYALCAHVLRESTGYLTLKQALTSLTVEFDELPDAKA